MIKKSLAYKIFRHNANFSVVITKHFYFYFIRTLEIIKEHYLENKLNIQTDEPYYFEDDLSLYKDGKGYQATPYGMIARIVYFLKLKPQDILIDFGSGSGRVVFFAALQNVRKVIGIELNKKLIDMARRNLNNYRLGNSPIEFVNTDAAAYRIKDENIFFMFNPFGYATLEKVIGNIKDSLAANPRQIRIIYYSPAYRIVLDRQDWLILEKKIGNVLCLIWRNKF